MEAKSTIQCHQGNGFCPRGPFGQTACEARKGECQNMLVIGGAQRTATKSFSTKSAIDKKTVPELLREGAATYEQRNRIYGDNYKRIGEMMAIMFPDGIPAMDAEGHNRFGAWYLAFNKLVRYGMQLGNGGHQDSAHDAMVYSAMLEELTK